LYFLATIMQKKGMASEKRMIRRIELAREIMRLSLQSGWAPGYHLKEEALCTTLGVSRSPVRAALEVLEEWGFVERQANRGYFLHQQAENPLFVGRDVPTSPEDDLMVRIVDARIGRELGEVVTQVEVMKLFGASRNTVDAALGRLASEGIMERRKGRGWQFLPTFESLASHADGTEYRWMIEPAAILMPSFQIDHGALSKCRIAHSDLLKNANSDKIAPGWIFRIDAEFHELIAAFSGNAFVLQAIQNQNRMRRIFEYNGYANRRRISDWCREHLAIIDALERGNLKAASALMQKHLENATQAARAPNMPGAP